MLLGGLIMKLKLLLTSSFYLTGELSSDYGLIKVSSWQNTKSLNNGKIGSPVKGATIIGNGPDILTKVSMVGNDMKLDPGIGTCGKNGQWVPVGVGQPSILVDEITVGGTQL